MQAPSALKELFVCPRNTCLSLSNCAFLMKKAEERELGLLWVPLFNPVWFLLSVAAKDNGTQRTDLHGPSSSPASCVFKSQGCSLQSLPLI